MEGVLQQLQAVAVPETAPAEHAAARPPLHIVETGLHGAVAVVPTADSLGGVLPAASTVPAGPPPGYALRDGDVCSTPSSRPSHS